MYIQDIEESYESTSKGKYFLITTKTDYRKVLTEANDMIKYIYPDRVTTELKTSIQRINVPIIHNNVSTYAQALMTYHESNPVPAQSSKKRLKLKFNAKSIPEKRNSTQEIPQLTQKENDIKSVTFNNIEDQPNHQQRLDDFGTPPNYSPTSPYYQLKESKANRRDNYIKPTSEEDPTTSFKKRIKQPTPTPHKINQPTTQQHSIRGTDREAYTRYEDRRGGRGPGREPHPFPRYSTIQDKGPKSTTTLETQEDIILDSESERSANWKD